MTRHRALLPSLLAVVTLILGAVIAAVFGMPLHKAALDTERADLLGILLGAAVGIGGPLAALLWYSHRVLLGRGRSIALAVGIGAGSGIVALLLASALENLTSGLPGWLGSTQGSGVVSSLIEEVAKLLVPILLLLLIARFRDPILGFWTAVTSGATFGLLEGVGYVLSAAAQVTKSGPGSAAGDEGYVMALDVLVRAFADIGHPLTTGGAAVVIWLAAASLSAGRAALAGIGAVLIAFVLHALNDGVLGYYIHNGLLAGLAILALAIVVFFAWYRPQLHRLARKTPAEV